MQFIPVRDALSCIRVCKTWTQHFARSVWHTIDFKTHEAILLLDPTTVQKYGHHIQAIENMSKQAHLEALGEAITFNRLISISVLLSKDDTLFNTHCQELIRSNKVIKPNEDGTEDRYQHLGLLYFIADADNLLVQYPIRGQSKSLLVHFPKLRTISTYGYVTDTFPIRLFWDEIRRWCPDLRNLETNCTPAPLIARMLTQAWTGLERVHFDYDAAAADIFLSLLAHRKTLVKLSSATTRTGFYEREVVLEVKDPLEDETWMVQCIPQQCQQLEELFLPEHAMNMDEVEKKEWRCRGLKDLRIRVQGIDTAEAIDRVVATWHRRRRVKQGMDLESRSVNADKSGSDATAEERDLVTKEQAGTSLEERVVRHLLKFDQLKSVWLGKAVRRL
ncbi:hypothetical protein BGZ75_004079 [Mortierella antarctica]|nr:hypothetical protein BGZ75_004079 [Mortierella antarctica]